MGALWVGKTVFPRLWGGQFQDCSKTPQLRTWILRPCWAKIFQFYNPLCSKKFYEKILYNWAVITEISQHSESSLETWVPYHSNCNLNTSSVFELNDLVFLLFLPIFKFGMQILYEEQAEPLNALSYIVFLQKIRTYLRT